MSLFWLMGFFSRNKNRFLRLLAFLISLLFIFSLGPLLKVDPSHRKTYVSKLSSTPAHLIPGAEEISMAPEAAPTHIQNFSFAYIHGFSSSRQELSPLVEDVATYYGAPAYFVRLAGHGIDDKGKSLAEGNCFDWLNDADRVIEKAKAKGRDLILIGTSFGGLLASFAALEHQSEIKALILISPMFELPNPIARFVSGPLGVPLARMILGPIHEFTPKNELNRKYWTTRYSTKVIPQLMNCENFMRGEDLSKIKIPLLVLYTEKDDVVSIQAIKDRFKDFGSSKKFLVDVPDANDHVLSGNIISPQTVSFVEKRIEEFLAGL